MLAAREHVDAGVARERRIAFAVDGRVNQRSRAPVVLVGRVRVEHPGHELGLHPRQQSVGRLCVRIGFGRIGEWEDVGGVELVHERVAVARRLCEAQVETAPAGARNMCHHAVERLAMALVLVEPVVHVGPEEAAALRDAEGDGAVNRACGNRPRVGRTVLEHRDRVTNRRRADAGDRWILRPVDDLVDLAGLEPSLQIDARGIRRSRSIGEAGELPIGMRKQTPRSFDRVTHGQRVRRVVRVGDLVRDVIAIRQ